MNPDRTKSDREGEKFTQASTVSVGEWGSFLGAAGTFTIQPIRHLSIVLHLQLNPIAGGTTNVVGKGHLEPLNSHDMNLKNLPFHDSLLDSAGQSGVDECHQPRPRR